MKLKYFKINSEFRGLPKPFTMKFREHNTYAGDNEEPICLVGLNGSGKSNSLEVLAELFYYLELQTISTGKALADLNKRYEFLSFEIQYEISLLKWGFISSRMYLSSKINENELVEIHWIKNMNEKPIGLIISQSDNKKRIDAPIELWNELLPNKVVGYSSGQNELISNPFLKLDFHYFDEFVKSTSTKNEVLSTNVNRMFFMDYESNEIIVLANYLFDEGNTTKLSKDEVSLKLGIESLHTFSLRVKFRNYDGKLIAYPSELNIALEQLKKCSTACFDNGNLVKNQRDRIVELTFYTDAAVKKAFRNQFKTPFELFRVLYLFRLMNIHCISPEARRKVMNAPRNTNLSDLVPKPEVDKLAFKVSEIYFIKKNATKPVRYKQLSDGEHQLLHIIGTVKMMKENDVLFLLDEPETHFNPEWRAKMIRLIMETNSEIKLEQDYFITSHSPFIISDCKPTNVYLFHRNNGKLIIQTAHDKRLNTFGTSVNILTEEIFTKNESQGEYSGATIVELLNRKYKTNEDILRAKEDAKILGNSVEKTLLFRKLIMLEDKLKKAKGK